MDKQVLKQVLLDNAQLVEKIEVLPRAYALDESANYVFTGVALPVDGGYTCV